MINAPLSASQNKKGSGTSVLLFRRESFEETLTALSEAYGAPGYAMIFSMGKNVGQMEFESIADEQKTLDIPMNRPNILKKALDRFSSMGWGRFQVDGLDLNGSANILIKNNPFSEHCSRSSVGCCFISGVVSGLLAQVFETEPSYPEPRCVAMPNNDCMLRLTTEKNNNKLIKPLKLSKKTQA